jgi:hypothetical protein
LLDAVYKNSAPPEFPLSTVNVGTRDRVARTSFAGPARACDDSIKILRENSSTRTAVRFREGKIYAPVAFTGTYSPPLLGCVEFAGYAESNVDLEFDRVAQKLSGRVRVLSVVLNGTNGLGSSLIAKMVQSSIDKKLNPVELIDLAKLSFPVTLQNSARLRMQAVGIRHEVNAGSLSIVITYDFAKG